METTISCPTSCNRSTRKVNAFYVDNLPESAEIKDICDCFATFNIYSILLLETKVAAPLRRGWILLEASDENINSLRTEELMGRSLNLRLMGQLFPLPEDEEKMPDGTMLTKGGFYMKMSDVQKKAKEMGVKIGRSTKKVDLIRRIQEEEGNSPCFQMKGDSCDQTECCWRKDCLL